MPKVSVITPCYNNGRFVGQTIESIRAQTLTDWEHVVIDDGSTDHSTEVVTSYAATEARLRLVSQPNGGVANARNNGFAACSAHSQYLLFLDADDCLKSTMLEAMAGYLDAHPEVGLVYCPCAVIDESGERVPEMEEKLRPFRRTPTRFGLRVVPDAIAETSLGSIFADWQAGVVPSVALIRRTVYEQTPGWNEALGHLYEDFDLWIHIALRSEIHFLPQVLVLYRKHDRQATADPQWARAQKKAFQRKWMQEKGSLCPEHREKIEAAKRLERRIVAFDGIESGRYYLRKGKLKVAVRFFGGAAWRYLVSLMPTR